MCHTVCPAQQHNYCIQRERSSGLDRLASPCPLQPAPFTHPPCSKLRPHPLPPTWPANTPPHPPTAPCSKARPHPRVFCRYVFTSLLGQFAIYISFLMYMQHQAHVIMPKVGGWLVAAGVVWCAVGWLGGCWCDVGAFSAEGLAAIAGIGR